MSEWTARTALGPYVLLEQIGAGGMGEVWRARDTRLDRTVAIKRLNPDHSARFEQEARAIAALNHPHVCQIHDVGPDYLVLEFVEGAAVRGPLPADEVVRLALQIASALEEAHARGICHRDLKPDNIFLTRKGTIKLLDFGIAKLTERGGATETLASAVMGTPLYMSPEQAEGGVVDPRSDLFSLGAVLYELVAGRRAFDTLAGVLRDPPAPLDAPAPLRAIILRCLRKQPADRFADARELRAALEHVAMPARDHRHSLAVLPFVNVSSDREQEYFSDGLTEEIITMLARVPGLKVTARTSAFAFKGRDATVGDVARELCVDHVLEGSVRKSAQRIRVAAQLVNAADGFQVWSERWDRELTDVFTVQDEIASAIAAVLETKLSAPGPRPTRLTTNVAAYEAYLKGRHFTWSFAHRRFLEARGLYEQAIALDPQFALAHAGLAEYFHIATSGFLDPEEAGRLGRAAAGRAQQIDPTLPEANAWLAIYALVWDFDWQSADRWFRVAVAQPTVPPEVRHQHAYFYLRVVGRAAEAVVAHRRALEEDPLNLIIRVGHAVSLRAAGRDEEAADEARRILEIDPDYAPAYSLQAVDVTKVPAHEALAYAERAVSIAPWMPANVGLLAGVLSRHGDEARARALMDGLTRDGRFTAVAFTMFHALRGEADDAAQWIERAIEQRDQLVPMLLLSPPYLPVLRSSTRWPAITRRLNLSETS
jgi:eukaryotic-like serine/threonine-protein kinase